MPFRRKKYSKNKRRNYRRRGYLKKRLSRLPTTGLRPGGQIVPFIRRFVDVDTVQPDPSDFHYLNINTDIQMSVINGIADVAKVFKWYRINKIKVTLQIPYNFSQTSLGGSTVHPQDQLISIYFRRKQTPTDNLSGLSENEMLEKGDVKRKMFNKKGQVSFYYTPNTWQNMNAPSAPVNTRLRKIYKTWYENTDTSTATSAVIHSGICGQVWATNDSKLPEGMLVKSYYTIYGQFKLMM